MGDTLTRHHTEFTKIVREVLYKKTRPNPENQTLVRNLGVIDVVVDFLREEINPENQSVLYHEITTKCFKFLTAVCKGNIVN